MRIATFFLFEPISRHLDCSNAEWRDLFRIDFSTTVEMTICLIYLAIIKNTF
ncbi:hypothetical protein SAMN05421827_11436 [Pedobacter terrae]|uniref:Uncharacterized protein n=1 Tax=Pedobacter terrae TaxID=405671 RepID=A0A1G7YNR0_9SPHI|nr:hypothetical protein SAMN05421827_11436 [Pedobacter terrae]